MTRTKDNNFLEYLNENGLWLAPLAGVTDSAFRRIAYENGANLATTEMISAKGLYYNNSNTSFLLHLDKSEKHTGIQIFGSDAAIMADITERFLNETDFAFVDINMGCPVKKVVSNYEGSRLMTDTPTAARVVEAIKKVSNKPVSVKMRLGYSREEENCVEFALAMQEAGADLIAIHARAKEDMFSGVARYEKVALAKRKLTVPVVVNGDVCDYASYEKAKMITSADGVMIGRGAMGNPFVFRSICSRKNGGCDMPPTREEKVLTAKRQFTYMLEYKNENVAVNEFRKQFAWYLKGLSDTGKVKAALNTVKTAKEVFALFDEVI